MKHMEAIGATLAGAIALAVAGTTGSQTTYWSFGDAIYCR